MLPHQSLFLGVHRGKVCIKKFNMNHLFTRTHLKTSYVSMKVPPCGYTFRKNDDHVLC